MSNANKKVDIANDGIIKPEQAKRFENRYRCILNVLQHNTFSVREFLDYALEEAIKITDSQIGYILHYNEQTQEFIVNSWSKGAMKVCSIDYKPAIFHLNETGIWGEVVRQRNPIIINDYARPIPQKKGLPQGHAPIQRFLEIPVLRNQQIVAVVAVANKEMEYDQADVIELYLLMDSIWKSVDIKRMEELMVRQNLQLKAEIEERVRAEIELQRVNSKMEQIYKVLPAIIIGISDEGYITVWNPAARKILGISARKAVNRKLSELPITWEFDKLIKAIESCQEKNCPIEINDLHFQYADSRSGRLDVNIIPVEGDKVLKNGLIILGIDITTKSKIENELARLDRLKLVGEIAVGIGHQIRNPMTSVRGFLQIFKEKYIEDREFLDLIIEELDSANAIISEYLSLARNRIVELAPNDLNEVLKSILPLAQSTAIIQDKNIKFECEELPHILLDQKEVRQIVLNLVQNGLEAMKPGGIITIKTFLDDNYIVLAVQDEGHGICQEFVDKIGTPFFTTKDNGTGLGLAVCYSIAERHNARIDFETRTSGTTFYVRFPVPS